MTPPLRSLGTVLHGKTAVFLSSASSPAWTPDFKPYPVPAQPIRSSFESGRSGGQELQQRTGTELDRPAREPGVMGDPWKKDGLLVFTDSFC